MKDTFYFSHDYNASMDEKIIKLLSKHGMAGYGVFWRIVENLYNNANALQTDYDRIAYDLHSADSEIVRSIISDFDLFVIEDGYFGSASIERRLDDRDEKSEKARQSAFKRWDKIKADANALKNDANAPKNDAIKERKGNKGKEVPEKIPALPKGDFIDLVIQEFTNVFSDYIIVAKGKERGLAGQLVELWKKQNPDLKTDELLKSLHDYFERCKNIPNNWHKNRMSLGHIVSQFNEINNILKAKHKINGDDQLDIHGKPRPSKQYVLLNGSWMVL